MMINPTSATVLEAAMQLSVADRAEFAAQLLGSLPSPPIDSPEEIQDVFARRIEEIDSGEVAMIPWEEVRAWLHRKIVNLPIEFHPDAKVEIDEARDWYFKQAPHVLPRLLDELDRSMDWISTFPMACPPGALGTRFTTLRSFP